MSTMTVPYQPQVMPMKGRAAMSTFGTATYFVIRETRYEQLDAKELRKQILEASLDAEALTQITEHADRSWVHEWLNEPDACEPG